jgi:hypothetical protein
MTEHKRKNIINAIQDHLEDKGDKVNEWEQGFLEDISKQLSEGRDLSTKQMDKLTDIIGYGYLK